MIGAVVQGRNGRLGNFSVMRRPSRHSAPNHDSPSKSPETSPFRKRAKLKVGEAVSKTMDKDKVFISGFEDGRRTKYYFERWKFSFSSCIILHLISIGLSVFAVECERDTQVLSDKIIIPLLILISCCTIGVMLLTFLSHYNYYVFERERHIAVKNRGILSFLLDTRLLFDLLMALPHPNLIFQNVRVLFTVSVNSISYNYYMHLNELMSLLQLIKCYQVISFFFYNSRYYDSSAQRVCYMYGVEPDFKFVLRCFMKNSPVVLLSLAYILSILMFGYALYLCERPTAGILPFYTYDSVLAAMWNVIVTMATVGYGDYIPQTLLGRFMSFLVCIMGLIFSSLLVVSSMTLLELNPGEKRSYGVVNRIWKRKELCETSAAAMGQLFKAMTYKYQMNFFKILALRRVKELADRFRIIRREYRAMLDDNEITSEQFDNKFVLLTGQLQELHEEQNKLGDLLQTIERRLKSFSATTSIAAASTDQQIY